VADDSRDVLGTAEHVDDVDALAATEYLRQSIQRGHRRLPQDALRDGGHGNDAVAEALQGTRDTVARAGAIGREPHDRDGVRVTPEQPILQAALSAGLNLPHSCKSGHCGSCRARLLTGAIHYPDGPPLGITAEEVGRGDILLCQARADSDLTVRARLIASVADVEIKTLPCRIARLTPLAPDVMQLWLRLPAVERLRFHPGQYLDVLLENGRRRSFSIASPPHDSEALELHVRRVSGGGFSERLFGAGALEGALGTGA